jgi:hypothetical protein
MKFHKKLSPKQKKNENNLIFISKISNFMENDVIIVCDNCGATKLIWQTVCPTCQGTTKK